MKDNENIIPHQFAISANQRNSLKGHRAAVLWFTGLSGSGKSTIADRVEQLLLAEGVHTYLLDGDNIRTGLNRGLGFSEEDRTENIRRIAEVCKLFLDAGLVALSAFVSPLKSDREQVKSIVGADNFIEIFINTSLAECERRDVKGLYKKARAGEIKNFTGIDAPYEVPEQPTITINTATMSIDQSAEEIVNYLLNVKKIKL